MLYCVPCCLYLCFLEENSRLLDSKCALAQEALPPSIIIGYKVRS